MKMPMTVCQQRPLLRTIFVSFISMQFFVVMVLVSIPIFLHLGTYTVKHIMGPSEPLQIARIRGPPRRLLLWSEFFQNNPGLDKGTEKDFTEYECDTRCEATTNKDLYNDTNGVVIHIRNSTDLPDKPPRKQYWVIYSDETSYMQQITEAKKRRQFHMAFTPYPKKLVNPMEKPNQFPDPVNYAQDRNMIAAMIVSHQNETSYYKQYLAFFKMRFKVDVFYKSALMECGGENKETEESHDCNLHLPDGYKFYILPDSAFSPDFVTDELRATYEKKVVPVIFGAKAYERILPANSYIDVYDFDTPPALVDHIVKLDHSDTEYNKYFKWVNNHTIYYNQISEHICKLCTYIANVEKAKLSHKLDLKHKKK